MLALDEIKDRDYQEALRETAIMYLTKSGLDADRVYEIVKKLYDIDNVDYTEDEIRESMRNWYNEWNSEGEKPKSRFISKEVAEFVATSSGYFALADCYTTLQATSKDERDAIRTALRRLKDKGIVEKYGKKEGVYRRVETELDYITFDDTEEVPFPIILPFNLHDMVDISEGNIILVGGEYNSGKGHPDGTLLLGENGWVKIEDIKIGDKIYSQDGSLSSVTGVFPRGEQQCVEFVFNDNTRITTDLDHLWTVITPNNRTHTETGHGKPNKNFKKYLTISAREIVKNGFGRVKPQRRYSIPSNNPIIYPHKDTLIDPYILGLLLGDGCLNNMTPSITTMDDELIKYCQSMWPSVTVNRYAPSKCFTVRLLKSKGYLERLGLWGHRSWEKFIPNDYLYNSVSVRLAILRGLLDTDGDISQNGMTICFNTVSKQLCSDVTFIVRSLGGRVTVTSRFTKYMCNGISRGGRQSYRLFIKLNNYCPFLLSRKASRYKQSIKTDNKIMTEYRDAGIKKTTCISIDNPSGLYIAQDFIVTHNTTFCLEVLLANKNLVPIRYLSSEVSHQSEFKKRWRKYQIHQGIPMEFWLPDENCEYISRSSDFSTALKPKAINIIDYLEFPESDFTQGAEILRQIHDKLAGGVAVIAVQKKKGTRLPRAGDLIMEKPRLAVTLSSADGQAGSNLGIAEIIKAKLCRGGNHNGKRLRFETVDDGSRFKVIEGWGFLRI